MRMKYSVAWLFLLIFVFSVSLCDVAKADIEEVKADAYILVDADTGKMLLSKNEHKQLPPASMTKLMTMILCVEALDNGQVNLKDTVVTSENAWKMGGSQIYLEPGEEMSFKEMLISIAAGSANDACVAVAEHLEGSHNNFVEKMNQRAKSLGLKDTHFVNAYGLPAEGHYTSPYDMAQIARYALAHPRILEYTSIKEYDLRQGDFKLYNTNKLLWWYKGADGFKTGWTNEAKYCLASTVKRDGLRLIAVVMASPEVRGHFRDSMELYNYGFAKYAFKSFCDKDSVCGVVKVGKGVQDQVNGIAMEDVGIIYAKGEKKPIKSKKVIFPYVNAPIEKGQKLGEYQILLEDQIQKKVDIVAVESIPRATLMREIMKMFAETFLF
ncbi:MAG: D-alanyl-D-alanine carboxypeptidase family protein [Bacillota bacterium]|nr:D-alanyl-D-alanine carboxypeptidase family protein [Bacillota bacterium]